MHFVKRALRTAIVAALFSVSVWVTSGAAQNPPPHPPVVITILDENNTAVPGAEVTIQEPGKPPAGLTTDYNGRASFIPQGSAPYTLQAQKSGFYASTTTDNDPSIREQRIILRH